jgi:Tat protein secretion system quality control protein TatD with DNase activity
VIRAVGIDSLVLESDRENYMAVREDLEANAQFIANALNMSKDDVVQKTAANARRFYGLA